MCLVTSRKKPYVAEEDIVCYKIIYHTPNVGYKTLYLHYDIPDSVIFGLKPFEASGNETYRLHFDMFGGKTNEIELDRGFIHSYKNLNELIDAEKCWFSYYEKDDKHVKIYKCIIPKGTKYFAGRYSVYKTSTYAINSESYCAKQIIFKEEITDWEQHETDNLCDSDD